MFHNFFQRFSVAHPAIVGVGIHYADYGLCLQGKLCSAGPLDFLQVEFPYAMFSVEIPYRNPVRKLHINGCNIIRHRQQLAVTGFKAVGIIHRDDVCKASARVQYGLYGIVRQLLAYQIAGQYPGDRADALIVQCKHRGILVPDDNSVLRHCHYSVLCGSIGEKLTSNPVQYFLPARMPL